MKETRTRPGSEVGEGDDARVHSVSDAARRRRKIRLGRGSCFQRTPEVVITRVILNALVGRRKVGQREALLSSGVSCP